MADPVNTIVDEIPLSEPAYWIELVNDSLYCGGQKIFRVDVRTKATKVIAKSNGAGCLALVDFHRPIDLPPDVAGAGAPDRRIYASLDDSRIGEIVPALLDH